MILQYDLYPDLAFLTLSFQTNITKHILQMKQKDVVIDSMLMSLETNLTTLETDFVSTMNIPPFISNFSNFLQLHRMIYVLKQRKILPTLREKSMRDFLKHYKLLRPIL